MEGHLKCDNPLQNIKLKKEIQKHLKQLESLKNLSKKSSTSASMRNHEAWFSVFLFLLPDCCDQSLSSAQVFNKGPCLPGFSDV